MTKDEFDIWMKNPSTEKVLAKLTAHRAWLVETLSTLDLSQREATLFQGRIQQLNQLLDEQSLKDLV